jgi:formylglycine-generating enzyme required for sulfatase activity
MADSLISRSFRLSILAAGLLGSACIRNWSVEPAGRSPGMDWIRVRGGTFEMGTAETGNDRRHTVRLSDFLITRTEVTNAVFAEFLNAYGSDSVKTGLYRGVRLVYSHP